MVLSVLNRIPLVYFGKPEFKMIELAKATAVLVAFVHLQLNFATCLEKEFTVTVDHGTTECFYQSVKVGQVMEIEYQVIDGDQGDLDINFHLYTPSGRQVVSDYKKGENSHKLEVSEEGDYKMCWDNTISSYNTKTVFFEIIIDQDADEWSIDFDSNLAEQYEIKVEDIMQSVSRVHSMLASVRQMQDVIRAHEARDRNIIENSFELVNSWSLIQIVVMLAVGAIQVVMVRSLFDDKSRFHGVWKKTDFLSR